MQLGQQHELCLYVTHFCFAVVLVLFDHVDK